MIQSFNEILISHSTHCNWIFINKNTHNKCDEESLWNSIYSIIPNKKLRRSWFPSTKLTLVMYLDSGVIGFCSFLLFLCIFSFFSTTATNCFENEIINHINLKFYLLALINGDFQGSTSFFSFFFFFLFFSPPPLRLPLPPPPSSWASSSIWTMLFAHPDFLLRSFAWLN